MKVLHIAAGLPTAERPYQQPFIKSQIDSLRSLGIDIHILEIRGYESTLNYLKSISRIKKIIKARDIDIIHAHYSYCAFAAILANVKKPIIVSLMGSDLLGVPDNNGKLTFRGKADKILSNIIAKNIDHIIVKSGEMERHLKTQVPVSVIPNGINFNVFREMDHGEVRKKLQFDKEDFIILFLGNKNIPRKNFALAQAAVDLLKQRMSSDKIRFINPFGIEHSRVVEYMNAANVLLMTSFWEGSPNVIKEAMACNLPIVSVDAGDVKEVISGTQHCYMAGYSKEDIFDKLKIIYLNRDRSNGREKIDHLRDEIIAYKIFNIYRSLLNKDNKSSYPDFLKGYKVKSSA